MDLELKDKVALVTGASKGIGRAIALALAREGARVSLCSRNAVYLGKAAARRAVSISEASGASLLLFLACGRALDHLDRRYLL